MEIVSEQSLGIPYAAANALSDDGQDLYDYDKHLANYWLGPNFLEGEFVIDIGCTAIIRGVSIRNGKNHHKDRGTKKFSIYLALDSEGPWTKTVTDTFEDPRATEPVPLIFHGMVEQAKYLKFVAEEYYGAGTAIQFIDVHSNYYDLLYTASYALKLSNCDHYTFSTEAGFK